MGNTTSEVNFPATEHKKTSLVRKCGGPLAKLAKRHGIEYLKHGTRLENLPGILQNGLKPKSALGQDAQTSFYEAEDSDKKVIYIGAQCLSERNKPMSEDFAPSSYTKEILAEDPDLKIEFDEFQNTAVIFMDLDLLDNRDDWHVTTTWRHKGRFNKIDSFTPDDFMKYLETIPKDPSNCFGAEFIFKNPINVRDYLNFVVVAPSKLEKVIQSVPYEFRDSIHTVS